MKNETVLWAVGPESKNWEEDIIVSVDAENPTNGTIIQNAMAWAKEQGFHNFRIAHYHNEKPDFVKALNRR